MCNLCLSPWAVGVHVRHIVTEKMQSLNCVRKWCLPGNIALRSGKRAKQKIFCFLKKKKNWEGKQHCFEETIADIFNCHNFNVDKDL